MKYLCIVLSTFITTLGNQKFRICLYVITGQNKSESVGRGRLTERLIAQGLLTPHMLQELKKEWRQVKSLFIY